MQYSYTTLPFAGLMLDTFKTLDGDNWVTLSSLAKALGIHQQTVGNWVKAKGNQERSLDVKVGKFNKAAKAYPTQMVVDFIDHLADKGNKEAKALRTATLKADLDRSIDESNGLVVTAAQHEKVRHSTRLALLQQWVKDNYQPTMLKNGVVVPIDHNMIREGDFENGIERQIVELEALIARRETYIASGKWGEAQVAQELKGIESYRKDIQTLAQSLSN